jgi:hypothetical protein
MRCRNCGTEQRLQELARGGGHGVPPRARWAMLTSAVNLKFLSLLAASSFRKFKFKTALES